jgi:hypothetical protein
MFKTFFITRQPETEIDAETEAVMQLIHGRMEKMLMSEETRRHRFTTIESTPSYYR